MPSNYNHAQLYPQLLLLMAYKMFIFGVIRDVLVRTMFPLVNEHDNICQFTLFMESDGHRLCVERSLIFNLSFPFVQSECFTAVLLEQQINASITQ